MLLDQTYTEVIRWRRNCFSVPTGKAGKGVVSELARLYQTFGSASALESVALKAAIVLPILLLQKPSKSSKCKDHIKKATTLARWKPERAYPRRPNHTTPIHPPAQEAHPNYIVDGEPYELHPVIFETLNASAIRSATLKMSGAAGPSGLDAHEWRRLCTSHKGASRDLCASLASVARRLCSSYIDPMAVRPLLASDLGYDQ